MAAPRVNQETVAFAELHCLSNYSFLRGASHPEELVERAHELGYKAIALTDECSYCGLVKAHVTAKKLGIKLIVGAEFAFTTAQEKDAANEKLVLLAPTRRAYGQLSAFISALRRRGKKGSYNAELKDFSFGLKECIALWIPHQRSIDQQVSLGKQLKVALPNLWLALELFHDGHDLDKTAHILTLSSRLQLPITAANNAHTHTPKRQPLQDILTAIRHKTTLQNLGQRGFNNSERTLRPLEKLASIYPLEMLNESVCIAEQCQFNMDELRYEYPKDLVPPHLTAARYLRQLTFAGAAERWPEGLPPETLALIEKELTLIGKLNYEHYFLTVQDIVQFARSQNILCQGRGSAANSAVCYCLFITEVDPARMHLLFERFVSMERNEPPDIDVDFEHERREEVIQYIYTRYGRDRAALAATLVTYRPRSAIKDVGKALGFDLDVLELLAKSLAWWDKSQDIGERLRSIGIDPDSTKAQHFLRFINEILGFPRHLSQHVGGFVISSGPLTQLVPVENAAMVDRTVIQWDKEDLEALGLLKVDVLALGMLTAIRKALDLCNADPAQTEPLCVQSIPAEDPDTYSMLQQGDSIGVFQVESRAQMAMLPRLKPKSFYDLVIEVAIVRPGPIQGDMVHPYLRRRQSLEQPDYPSPAVEHVLKRTLGIPIFQEQVIELAMVAAGFSAGEADQLRRAMAAWKRRGGLEQFHHKLVAGMQARGHDREFAERVFNQIKGFGEYGFPESHAASFALLVYVSAWLKRHKPAAFYCGLLNSLPMGFYSPSQLIQDAVRHGIEIRPVDVCISQWDHTLEKIGTPAVTSSKWALRLGLRLVKGLNKVSAERITQAQTTTPIKDSQDLATRAQLGTQQLSFLARAGALANLTGHRHQAHWEVAAISKPLPIQHSPATKQSSNTQLRAPSKHKDMLDDYRYTGLTLGQHPMALLRNHDDFVEFCCADQLEQRRPGQFVRIAGLVTGRQRPGTASGVVFLTLEDETGNINVIVWSSIMARFRAALLQSRLLKIKGVVEREGIVIHVVAGHVEDASHMLHNDQEHSGDHPSTFKSRDFH
jgi:error-prone DNA polymerase